MAIEQTGEVMRQLRMAFAGGSAAGMTDAELLERYAERGDSWAFEAIVTRHGAMVLGVCRRVLGDTPEADDAFQATFLVLAKRADGLRVGDSVAPWLFGVARRVALRARSRRGRLRARERPMANLPDRAGAATDPDRIELRDILDEELGRLPEKYRAPVVLCHLEGLTHEQASRVLGCPPGTVGVRLMRARERLRGSLARRGLAAPAGLAAGLAGIEARAAVPPKLIEAVGRLAVLPVRPGTIPDAVASLSNGVIAAMIRAKWTRLFLVMTTGTAIAAVAVAGAMARTGPPIQEDPEAIAAAAPEGSGATLAGVVVDEQEAPAEGVRVVFSTRSGRAWGSVVAEAVTDAEGRFRLEAPGGSPADQVGYGVLWAYEPGKLVASIESGIDAILEGLPARLALGPPSSGTTFEIRGPDGSAIQGATIAPRVLNRGFASVPDGLAERIAADTVTDAQGRVTLSAFLPEEISTVMVTAEGLGSQQFGFGHRDVELGLKEITLLPVGRVVGRIEGPPETIGGVRLTVGTNSRSHPSPFPGLAYVTTDAEGRFEVPEIAAGNLGVSPPEIDPSSPFLLEPANGLPVEPGRTTEVTLGLIPGVRVTGLVRAKETGAPIEGARISFRPGASEATTSTDAEGRFEGFARPGQFYWNITPPDGFARLMYAAIDLEIPEGVEHFELPPIELVIAGTVRGVVVDSEGEPIPGAEVSASWQVDEGPNRQGRDNRTLRTDAEGFFTIDRVPIGAEVRLTASAGRLRSPEPSAALADAEEPSRLVLDDSRSVALAGRILDEDGAPVPGAKVHLRALARYDSGQLKGDDLVRFDDQPVLLADAEGRFSTPPDLDREGEYAAFADAEGFRPERTPWTSASSGRFPDLVLRRDRDRDRSTLLGTVRERDGSPVPGAKITVSSVEGQGGSPVSTDNRGAFRVERVAEGPAFLFVSADGFRFSGRLVRGGGEDEPIAVTIDPSSTPPPADSAMRTLPPPLSRDEERAFARRIFEPALEHALADPEDLRRRHEALATLPALDPNRALGLVDSGTIDARLADTMRSRVALQLAIESPEEASAVAESIVDASSRARALIDIADALPDGDREGKLALLDRAAVLGRGLDEPSWRLILLANVAEHWIDLGLADRREVLLRELEPVARSMATEGWDGFARGHFAEELAQIDPEAGISLAEGLRDTRGEPTDRHLINIAQELASRDPDAALALLDRLEPSFTLSRALPRIGFAMAADSPDHAPRLLRFTDASLRDPFAVPFTLGMMARARLDDDPEQALGWLRSAFDELDRIAPQATSGVGHQSAATVGAALLPVAEAIDPGLVPEFFWRALSYRDARSRLDRVADRAGLDAALAVMLSRYDREVAAALVDPVAPRLGEIMTGNFEPMAAVWALASIDPKRAAEVVEALPDQSGLAADPFRSTPNDARQRLSAWLAAGPDRRWDRALENILNLWVVGGEDIF